MWFLLLLLFLVIVVFISLSFLKEGREGGREGKFSVENYQNLAYYFTEPDKIVLSQIFLSHNNTTDSTQEEYECLYV